MEEHCRKNYWNYFPQSKIYLLRYDIDSNEVVVIVYAHFTISVIFSFEFHLITIRKKNRPSLGRYAIGKIQYLTFFDQIFNFPHADARHDVGSVIEFIP